jgi:hypothetical protein
LLQLYFFIACNTKHQSGSNIFTIEDDESIYFMTIYPDNEKVASIWEQIPEEIQIMLNGNFIEGVGVGNNEVKPPL